MRPTPTLRRAHSKKRRIIPLQVARKQQFQAAARKQQYQAVAQQQKFQAAARQWQLRVAALQLALTEEKNIAGVDQSGP
jgi:hypothetical protein